MLTKESHIGFIGIGAIAEAVIVGLMDHGNFAGKLLASKRGVTRTARLADRFKNFQILEDNQQIVDQCETVFIAVLPNQVREVLMRLNFSADHSIVSMAAGITINEIGQLVARTKSISRIIPLPPIENGIGPMPICPPNPEIRSLFEHCADVIEVENEEQFRLYSAASGLMSTHHALTSMTANWLESRGVPSDNASLYASSMFHGLANAESKCSTTHLANLAETSATTGGLNEQVLRELNELRWFDVLRTRLDNLDDRLQDF